MDSRDIERLVRWAVDSDLKTFAEDAYGITGTAYDRTDDYIMGKFKQMQSNFIMWIAGLDGKNRARLARNITFNETEKEMKVTRTDINEIGVEATKIMFNGTEIMRKKGE
jgi:hypothetical protein